MLSVAETVNGVQQIVTSALLAVKIYILGLIWGIDSLYLFNSHSKEKNDNLWSSGLEIVLKVDILLSLENYIRSAYYSAYPITLYFQLHFMKIHRIVNAKCVIEYSLIKRLSANRQRDLNLQKENIMEIQKRKGRQWKGDMMTKRICETIEKCVKNPTWNFAYKFEKYQEVLLLY